MSRVACNRLPRFSGRYTRTRNRRLAAVNAPARTSGNRTLTSRVLRLLLFSEVPRERSSRPPASISRGRRTGVSGVDHGSSLLPKRLRVYNSPELRQHEEPLARKPSVQRLYSPHTPTRDCDVTRWRCCRHGACASSQANLVSAQCPYTWCAQTPTRL